MNAPVAVAQTSFTSGELSPSLFGRVDLARYYVGLKTCRNFIVRPFGGVVNRPGTMLCASVKDHAKKVRLVPFQYSTIQTYVLEFGHLYMRVHKDGAQVVYPVGDPNVGQPVEIVTPWAETDLPLLSVVQSADVMTICHPSYYPQQLSRLSHYSWTLAAFANTGGPFEDINIDTDKAIYASATLGAITLSANFAPWTDNDAGDLFYVEQMPDGTTKRWATSKSITAGFIRRSGSHYYQATTTATTGTTAPDHLEGKENDGDPGVIWEYLHSGFGIARITSLVVGVSKNVSGAVASSGAIKLTVTGHGLQTGESTTVANVGGTTEANGTWEVNVVDANNIILVGSTFVNAYTAGGTAILTAGCKVNATVVKRLPDGVAVLPVGSKAISAVADSGTGLFRITATAHGYATGAYIEIAGATKDDGAGNPIAWTGLNNKWVITFVNANAFDLQSSAYDGGTYMGGGTATNINQSQATYKWAKAAWSKDNGYPVASHFYQQRQVFGGTTDKPNAVWMSATAGFTDFSQNVPTLDDDALWIRLNAERVNTIQHFAGLTELIALTSEGPWAIRKEQGTSIPATSQQGEGGTSTVPPLKVGKQALHVQAKGGAVASLGYEFNSDSYEGDDLTIFSNHLFTGRTVVSWAYQKAPFSCVWVVLDDGALLGLTYMPKQEVVGWHRHDTDGIFESVCVVSEGAEDAVYFAVKRTIGGQTKRYIERLTSRLYTDTKDAVFLDSALSYDGRTVASAITWTLTGGTDWTHQETLTFTAGSAFFAGASDVGDMIVVTDDTGTQLRLRILEYVSATVVKVLANRTVPAEFRGVQQTGFWMARDFFSGLSHLEGKTVSIFADGNVAPQAVVTGGAVSLQTPAVVVHVGLPITADLETLDINVQGQSIQDKFKNVGRVILMVEKTRGLSIGPDADHLYEMKPQMSGQYELPVEEVTGPVEMNIVSDWSRGGRIFIRQTDPLPATILAAIPQVAVSNG